MEKFLQALKERAAFFLSEMGHFKPFSAVLRADGEIVDIISDLQSGSLEVMYEILMKGVQQDLRDTDSMASAIVLIGKADGHDVVVIEIFTNFQAKYQAIFPYTTNDEIVNFGPDQNKQYHTITN